MELEGFENCHIRDGAALCQFFAWLEKEVPKGYVTEMIASDKLFELRSLMSRFMGLSFETISAGGKHSFTYSIWHLDLDLSILRTKWSNHPLPID